MFTVGFNYRRYPRAGTGTSAALPRTPFFLAASALRGGGQARWPTDRGQLPFIAVLSTMLAAGSRYGEPAGAFEVRGPS